MDSAIKLKVLREEKNLTQFELAEELGVSVGSIGNVESGSREISKGLAIKLAKKFGTGIRYWLDENNSINFSSNQQDTSVMKLNINNIEQDFESLSSIVSILINEKKIRLDNLDNLNDDIKKTLFNMLKIDISNTLYKYKLQQLEEFIQYNNLESILYDNKNNKNNKK